MNNIETCWKKIKCNIKTAAIEAIGQSQIKTVDRSNNKEWYCPEIKELTNEKRLAYIRFRSKKTSEYRSRYIEVIKRKYWEQNTGNNSLWSSGGSSEEAREA